MSSLKQDLDEELSEILREYEARGLDPAAISDSLCWHAELAESRVHEDTRVLTTE